VRARAYFLLPSRSMFFHCQLNFFSFFVAPKPQAAQTPLEAW
jgi:hypothetical protein